MNKPDNNPIAQSPGRFATEESPANAGTFTWLLYVAILVAVQYLAVRLGLVVGIAHGTVSPVWPATGVAIAALLRFGIHLWPGVALGSFLALLQTGIGIPVAGGQAAAALLEAVTAVWLVRRFTTLEDPFAGVRDVIRFCVLAGGPATAISATVGVGSLVVGGLEPWDSFGYLWGTWWLGDMMGALIIAPFLIVWTMPGAWDLDRQAWTKTGLVFALLILAGIIAFWGPFVSSTGVGDYPLAFLTLPMVVAATFLAGRRGATAASLIASTLAISGTAQELGPFFRGGVNESLLLLQSYLVVVAVTAVILAAVLRERDWALEGLRRSHDELDKRVVERTREIVAANEQLTREVAERRRVETALRESEQKYRFLADNLQDVLWTVDLNLRSTYVSPSVEKVLGFTPEERKAQSVEEQLTPESLRRASKRLAEELALAAGNEVSEDRPVVMNLDFIAKNGEIVCLETVMSFIRSEAGRPLGVLGLSRDITDRKRAEQALRESEQRLTEIIDFLPDATFVIDNEGTVVAWNRAVEEMTGIPASEMLGKGEYEYALPFHGERRPVLVDLVNNRDPRIEKTYDVVERRGRKLIAESAHTLLTEQGVYLAATAGPLFDSQGNVTGAIESVRDITDRKNTEKALQQAKEAAESASRARSDFLANMSHEIRTPLNAVLGMIDLLQESDLSDEQRSRIGIAKSAADVLLALLNDILDFSRIEAGKLELEEIDFDLRALVDGAVSLVRVRSHDKGLNLVCEVDDEVPELVRGDPNRLRQVLLNLANNAVKFTDRGKVSISVGLADRSDDGLVLKVQVADTGIGIHEDRLGAIFERFSQADSSTTRKYGGTGLGLAIASELIRAMNGTITVESTPGHGSVFRFTVHLARAEAEKRESGTGGSARSEPNELEGMKILLVEDNEFNQAVALEVLKKLGCRVVLASNGPEAVRLFDREPFDVILMDLQMPDMDGFETTRRIRRAPGGAGIPIIAQTAHAYMEHRERCLAVGMNEHISKPVMSADLARVLRRYAGSRTAAPESGEAQPQRTDTPPTIEPDGEHFRVHEFMQRVDGDMECAQDIARTFVESLPGNIGDLKKSLDREALDEVKRHAHSIKGASAAMAAPRMYALAAHIEEAADGERMPELHQLMDRLADELETVRQVLAKHDLT